MTLTLPQLVEIAVTAVQRVYGETATQEERRAALGEIIAEAEYALQAIKDEQGGEDDV